MVRFDGSVKRGSFRFAVIALAGSALAACASQPPQRSSEYFPEAKYGKASPRVASNTKKIPDGGGHYQLGDPYQVAGVWYYPKNDPDYSRVGRASWYGAAFHGRLTANGEVYNMHELTAASPTLPLPSYARVTNLANGSSVIVRVNDRGPFAKGRIIDLSAQAAKMLAYKDSGVAKVKVDYVGPAPIEGSDESYLVASYRPGRGQDIGQPASGVMLAMNGSTPTQHTGSTAPASYRIASLAPIPGVNERTDHGSAAAALETVAQNSVRIVGPGDPSLPNVGPIVTDRPEEIARIASASFELGSVGSGRNLVNSYADQRVASASSAETAMSKVLDPRTIAAEWRTLHGTAPDTGPTSDYVNVGLFSNETEARRVEAALAGFGSVQETRIPTDTNVLVSLNVVPREGEGTDAILRAAWNVGAKDAFTVRAAND